LMISFRSQTLHIQVRSMDLNAQGCRGLRDTFHLSVSSSYRDGSRNQSSRAPRMGIPIPYAEMYAERFPAACMHFDGACRSQLAFFVDLSHNNFILLFGPTPESLRRLTTIIVFYVSTVLSYRQALLLLHSLQKKTVGGQREDSKCIRKPSSTLNCRVFY
jgi:hypothetical protein